jgi:hypothetical protein
MANLQLEFEWHPSGIWYILVIFAASKLYNITLNISVEDPGYERAHDEADDEASKSLKVQYCEGVDAENITPTVRAIGTPPRACTGALHGSRSSANGSNSINLPEVTRSPLRFSPSPSKGQRAGLF